ncbi:ATP-grasp domain-containing protein [Clostridium perfringens]|nr:ATP-grasp domain-containing protein [Clostridium perfringens]
MKKIMIIGAGPLQLPVIKKVKELGFKSICIDKNKDSVGFEFADIYNTIDIIDEEECYNFAKLNKIDGVLTVATDYGVLTTSYIAERLNLKGLDYKKCKIIKNKYEIRKKLSCEDNNLKQFYEISNMNDLDIIKNDIEYPVIVKPIDGSGSKGVNVANNYNEIKDYVSVAKNSCISKKVIVESFITGNEYGVECFVYNKKIYILAIMEKVMTKYPIFSELGHVTINLDSEIAYNIKKVVRNTINILGINYGSVNMDILYGLNGPVVIDIGARAGGNLISSHIVPMSTGIDLYKESIKASLGYEPDLSIKSSNKTIATRILNLNAGQVKSINFNKIEELKDKSFVKDIILNINIGSYVREYRNNLDSCGYVVVEGNSVEDAKDKALKIRDEIEKNIDLV